MEKLYKMIEWIRPKTSGDKALKFAKNTFQQGFKRAIQNAIVPESKPYRQAIRRMLRLGIFSISFTTFF
jgi:hypothetical protein